DGYTFTSSEESLAEVSSESDFVLDQVDDWVWLVLENEVPKFAIVEVDGIIYIISAPENTADYLSSED
ncbi:MAG: hypothetical protein V2J42_15420, partial [Wenzhouxiangella sp.]|nr:hypothetical protein [Wenzhouxiangella sp.]